MSKEELGLEEILFSIDMLCETAGQAEACFVTTDYSRCSREELERMQFGDAQIGEIEEGIRQNLPVEHYAKNCYNWKQMREIRKGLSKDLDISRYDNDFFSAEQMCEIRKGLLDHLDVSSYASLVFSAGDMARMRKNLMDDAYVSNPTGHAKVFTDEESGVRIRISDNCMKAYMTVPKGKKFSVAELERTLKRNDICHGISKGQLKKAADGGCAGELLVAEGTKASTGTDGRYEYFFDAVRSEVPKIQEDGSVDYTKVTYEEKRNPGDALAKYHPAEQGTDGETVTGIRVRGEKGRDLAVLHGHGVKYDEAKKLYTASETGYVVLDEEAETLNIWNVYVTEGDLNRYNGNITYDGIIYVKGAVHDMAEIEASGDVIVEGYVEGASIKAGGNIILESGMNGCGRGTLEAGGKVSGRFFEAVSIHAKGDVEGTYFLNCNVVTDRSLIAKQEKAKIVGSSIQAGYAVETYSIVSSGRPSTSISVGNPAWIEKNIRDTEKKLAKVEDELRQLTEGKEKIGGMFGGEVKKQSTLFHQVCVAIRMKEEESQELKGELAYQEKMRKRAKCAYVKVLNSVQAGVVLSVCGKMRRIEQDTYGCVTFRTEAV